jgi:hypothetical protein
MADHENQITTGLAKLRKFDSKLKTCLCLELCSYLIDLHITLIVLTGRAMLQHCIVIFN